MKPLTAPKYFWTNKKRGATVLIILLLSIATVSFITSLVTSIIVDTSRAFIEPFSNMSMITGTSDQMFLSEEIIDKVRNFDEVEYVFDVNMVNTNINTLVGINGVPVIISEVTEDIERIMEAIGLYLESGRLPSGEQFEIALHEKVLRNKGLEVGDYMGSEVADSEWLSGRYKIVGRLGGESLVSFANKTVFIESFRELGADFYRPMAQLLIPRQGQIDEMNRRIEELDSRAVSYFTLSSLQRMFDEQLATINAMLTLIIVVVVFIISISISSLMYIVYMNRSEEFGILYAMGYRKSFIKNLILKEIMTLSVVSWIGGYLFSWGMFSLINMPLYERGQTLHFFTMTGLINTLIVPTMTIICSSVPLLRKFRKWDPIAIIERRD